MNFSPENIAEFWERHPCGSDFVEFSEWKKFFFEYDKYKYSNESHILKELANIDWNNKKVLEIGLGQGSEAQKIILKGALYNGIDITSESIKRIKLRCELFNLPYESLKLNNAEEIDFPDNYFDIVFSHGVIHHSPRIQKIVSEIYRVLKPGGEFVIMLYHRNSVNYKFSIMILRRLGIFLLFIPGMSKLISRLTNEPLDRLRCHISNLKEQGLSYLKMDNFVHKATDGPDNIFSSVFSESETRILFSSFKDLRFTKHFINERHLPFIRSILSDKTKNKIASRYGWHLWCKGVK